MLKFYNNRNKVYPINNSNDHYITIHNLHYKPFYLKENNINLYKRQQRICERLCYGIIKKIELIDKSSS